MSTGQWAWILLALAGGAAGAGFLVLLRVRLMSRYNRRPNRDGWERGRLPLAGFALSVLCVGIGLGGHVATRPLPESPGWWGSLIRFGPEPSSDLPPVPPRVEDANHRWYSMFPPDPHEAAPPEPGPRAEEGTVPAGSAAAYEIPTPYGVRVGVFRQTANVDGVVRRLRQAGHTPLVVRREDAAGAPVYYIYAGTYATRAEAAEAARKIRSGGGDAMVVDIDPTDAGG